MPLRIAVVGSIVMDLVVRAPRFPRPGETVLGGPFERFPGGKGANQAVAAARLGASAALIGCVGDDDHGFEMLETLAREGVDLSGVATALGERTGVGCITVAGRGDNSIVLAPGANLCVTPEQIDRDFAVLREADAILMQLEVPLETIEHIIRRKGELNRGLILNAAPAIEVSDEVLRAVDVLVVNEIEAAALARGMGAGLSNAGSNEDNIERLPLGAHATAIVTLGARGAISRGPDGRIARHLPFPVEAVDSTGAGDAFCAALAVALPKRTHSGADFDDAVRFACAAGALACTRAGAIPALPTFEDVMRMLKRTEVRREFAAAEASL